MPGAWYIKNYGPICVFANYDLFSLWLRMGTWLSRLWFLTHVSYIYAYIDVWTWQCMNGLWYLVFFTCLSATKRIFVYIMHMPLNAKDFGRKSKIRKNETQETFTTGKLPPHTHIHSHAGYSNDVQKLHTHTHSHLNAMNATSPLLLLDVNFNS